MIVTLGDWLKPAPVFQPMGSKAKPIAPYTRDFLRALSHSRVITRNSGWFISLFASVVVGRSNYFFDSHFENAFFSGKDINLNCRVDHPRFLTKFKQQRGRPEKFSLDLQ